MQEILALTLDAMHLDQQRLDRVAANLANATTPGYKREVAASQPLAPSGASFATALGRATQQPGSVAPMNTSSYGALVVRSDLQASTLKSTGQSLDLALAGPGYFEVSTDQGPAYTRQGNFHVDARGRLVDAKGNAVMGKGGEIYLAGPAPTIDAAGNVYEDPTAGTHTTDGQAVAQLRLVQFAENQEPRRLGDGLLAAAAGTEPLAMKDADVQLRQGFLENSNVGSMQEMVQLMQTTRHFESLQKAALAYDDMVGQAVRKLGDLA